MNSLAVVPQGQLGKALRVADNFGSLRPGIAVAVQSDPFDS
jgi:hypothetical protein